MNKNLSLLPLLLALVAAVPEGRPLPSPSAKGMRACKADLARWCKDVKAGEGRLGACLKERSKELSKTCLRWAAHGGKAHVEESLLRDLDGRPSPKS